MTALAETRPTPLARSELGRITIADRVVGKIAAQAAAEIPDAGAAAAGRLGRAVPGAGRRHASLDATPKTAVHVDGVKAYVNLEIAVRWEASVPEVAERVRGHVRDRVLELAGVEVDEVHIVVSSLVTALSPQSRVR
jgi:uncharacterized alkaline shock family protein YloU